MKRTTTKALEILKRLTGDGPAVQAALGRADLHFAVAQMIYDARTSAGFTQRDLAQLVGTRQSVIPRLEDADYEGHSLTMLHRIADVLGFGLEVRFTPIKRRETRRRRMKKKPVIRAAMASAAESS